MDEIVVQFDDTPELIIELTELSLDIIISDIQPEASIVLTETNEPDIIEIIPDLPFYVQVFEWPNCPDEPPVSSIDLPIGPTDVTYANADYSNLLNVKNALDKLLYVVPSIESLNSSVTIQEVGAIVNTITLTWQYNKPMLEATLSSVGLLSGSINTYTFNSVFTQNIVWSLQAYDGQNYATKSVALSFLRKCHYGTSSKTSLTSIDILALTGQLATTRAQSRRIDGNLQYIYFAYPLAWGAAIFKVNGLQSTAWIQSIVSHTNEHGNITDYLVYRSTTIQSGLGIIIEVS